MPIVNMAPLFAHGCNPLKPLLTTLFFIIPYGSIAIKSKIPKEMTDDITFTAKLYEVRGSEAILHGCWKDNSIGQVLIDVAGVEPRSRIGCDHILNGGHINVLSYAEMV